jgi:plastocyanin
MRTTGTAVLASFVATFGFASIALAQSGGPSAPHTIVVRLVEQPGPMPYGFEPANFTAAPGDTIKFVQAASVLHNVHFKTAPKGARLGSAAVSQYLTSKGQSTSLVIDSRFVEGKYEIVCDPHETIGMHAFLTVEGGRSASNGGTK